MTPLIVEQLEYGYREPLFHPLSFRCRRGEVLAILGANGQGKTTLLQTLLGILPPLSGHITRHSTIGFVPQSFSPPNYRALDIVLMGRASAIGLLQMPSRQDEDIAIEALRLLGIVDLASRGFNQLSGGQRQLVLIARALAMRCQTLILDEPTTALDLRNQQRVLQLIHQLAQQQRISVIFTTHSPSQARLIADRALLLMPEQRWLYGSSVDLLQESHLIQTYGVTLRAITLAHRGAEHTAFIPLFDIATGKS